jgi:hypothetical protein
LAFNVNTSTELGTIEIVDPAKDVFAIVLAAAEVDPKPR